MTWICYEKSVLVSNLQLEAESSGRDPKSTEYFLVLVFEAYWDFLKLHFISPLYIFPCKAHVFSCHFFPLPIQLKPVYSRYDQSANVDIYTAGRLNKILI